MPILANIIQEAFSPLISLFQAIMVFIHEHIVPFSWGLAIIGLTVVVRAVMVPLTLSQFRSMRKLQLLMPEMKAIQERYKDDKQRQNEELMKFYRENKVNPFASCLPLVLQLPVFIALYYMLREDLKKHICGPEMKAQGFHTAAQIQAHSCNQVAPGSAKFLFIPDITTTATGWVLVVLIVLYIATQLLSTVLMSATTDRNQRLMMLGLPFVFTIFVIRFPAGLLVYWITTNLWTMGQGYFVRRTLGPPPPPPSPKGKAAAAPDSARRPPPDRPAREPALSGAGAGAGSGATAGARTTAPPPPPRKRKKRSGRRR
ncbi:MAG: YidC/Oxa1 family membrane protein insertase [Solirubrobacterales bacterium]|nr:YidC/Oxa1 family membrane protein insertase [Solirubrobacterales bacterium]